MGHPHLGNWTLGDCLWASHTWAIGHWAIRTWALLNLGAFSLSKPYGSPKVADNFAGGGSGDEEAYQQAEEDALPWDEPEEVLTV